MATRATQDFLARNEISNTQQDWMPSWHGEWQSNLDGSAEIRPIVTAIEAGVGALDYLPGIQVSRAGGEPLDRWGDEVQSSKEIAIAEATKMARDWHRDDLKESTHDLARAITNAAEKLNVRDVDSIRPDEAAALVKADLFILGMVGHSDGDARSLAVGALAEISGRHSAYREALIAQDPAVASEVQQAIAEDLRRVVAKEDRKSAALSPGSPESAPGAKAGMSAALNKAGEVYLVDLDQAAVHLVSHEGQRIVVGTGDRDKGLFMTRPDGHFEVVGSTSREIDDFIERNQLYALEAAAVSVLAREKGIDGYRRSGEESPLAVEIRDSQGKAGYAVAVTGPEGNPGVQFRWSLDEESEIYSSVGELELAGHAQQLRADAIFDSIELAQISGLPGRSIETQDLETSSIVNEHWQRIDSVPDAWMHANYETGMAEVKEDGAITSVSGLAAITRWAEEHGATPVDKERLVDLDVDAARGRSERERELDPTTQLEEIQLRADAPRIGSTMPRPDWIETMKLMKLKDPDAPVKVFIPKSGTEYGGQVLMVTDTHAIQRVGKGIAIAHDLNKLANRSSIVSDLDTGKISRGMEMRVDYGLEKGNARFFSVDPQQAATMRRDLTSWAEKHISNDRARQVYLKHLDSAALETPKSRGMAHRQLPMSSTSSRDVQHSR
ncbi:hypothetical protein J2W32_006469 [Variovorax boronicumulans]|uniref:KfrB domain-containing protein n=1 Tax=Variovorax boronicumulans TaxID=436515 RepID=A0AAW8D9Z1_9BURK|nr:hypothetical protein [Variovorax boronicumulans]MDP9897374.1 hypothetical protein [Variovorax boronicumulans]MDQ0057392.1 hypothetical protein [Variovorax boronicumulans]